MSWTFWNTLVFIVDERLKTGTMSRLWASLGAAYPLIGSAPPGITSAHVLITRLFTLRGGSESLSKPWGSAAWGTTVTTTNAEDTKIQQDVDGVGGTFQRVMFCDSNRRKRLQNNYHIMIIQMMIFKMTE